MKTKAHTTMNIETMNAIYEMARDIYQGKADVNVCQSKAFELYGVSEGSFAGHYVKLFKHLYEGRTYKRSVPQALLSLYLERIWQEYGMAGLKNALESYKGTIQYFEQRGTNRPGDRKIYEKYLRILHGGSQGKNFASRELNRNPGKDNLEVRVFNAAGQCVYSGFASDVSVRQRSGNL